MSKLPSARYTSCVFTSHFTFNQSIYCIGEQNETDPIYTVIKSNSIILNSTLSPTVEPTAVPTIQPTSRIPFITNWTDIGVTFPQNVANGVYKSCTIMFASNIC